MARAKGWTCRHGHHNPPRTRKCRECNLARPKRKPPAHQMVLDLIPYEQWVEEFGEVCGICGRPRMPGQARLHRDHDHKTGDPRGLLCHRCNRALPNWMTPDWLEKAVAYLRRRNRWTS
jgi:hypothetical protein